MLQEYVKNWFDVPKVAGTIGIEIETEGENLPQNAMQYWVTHPDGSLRDGGLEYVLARPLDIKKVPDALDEFTNTAEFNKTKFNFSSRTSVHIHYNVQDYRLQQIYSILCTYFILEELLILWSGPKRLGNLFCLDVRSAEYLPLVIKGDLSNKRFFGELNNERLKYMGCNIAPLRRFGSLEFRTMEGNASTQRILNWIHLLDKMITTSANSFQTPKDIVYKFSFDGADEFLDSVVLPWFAEWVREHIADYRSRMWRGYGYAVDVAYATDEWITEYPTPDAKPRRKKAKAILDEMPEDVPINPVPQEDRAGRPVDRLDPADLAAGVWVRNEVVRPVRPAAPPPPPPPPDPAPRQWNADELVAHIRELRFDDPVPVDIER